MSCVRSPQRAIESRCGPVALGARSEVRGLIPILVVLQYVTGEAGRLHRRDDGGVACAAHVGGFVAGLVLVKLFAVGLATK